MRPAPFVRGLVMVCLLCLSRAPVIAQTLQYTPQEAQLAAVKALESGNPELAFGLAQALEARNPNQYSVQLLLSYAARDMGQTQPAKQAALRAMDLAQNDAQRHSAALAVAQAHSTAGQRMAAQLWLRRAYDLAPTAAARAQTVRDYRYVRSRNPLSLTFNLGVSPTSNINGGSTADTIWLFGLPFALSGNAQALSGVETHAAAGLERTIVENERMIVRLGGNLAGRSYRLSSAAKALAPQATGSDYAFWAGELHVSGRVRAAAAPANEWDFRLIAGHNSQGGSALSNYGRLALGHSFTLQGGRGLRLGATVERQWRLDSPLKSATLRSLDLELHTPLARGQLSFGLQAGEVNSDATQLVRHSTGLSLGYRFALPSLNTRLNLSGSYEKFNYALMPLIGENRTDHRLSLGLTAELQGQQYMGFAPEIGVGYSRNRSNSPLDDSREMNLSLRLKSLF